MTTKMIREIEKEEIKDIKTLHVTPLFIISEGKLTNEKIYFISFVAINTFRE